MWATRGRRVHHLSLATADTHWHL